MLQNNKTQQFIEKARKIHGDKYDYSKVEYVNNSTKVCIICPIHGEFWQTPSHHIHKAHPRGCPKCNGGIKLTQEEFIKKARNIHGNKYDYSKVNYTNSNTKVCIICLEHGEFWQLPCSHTNGKAGCPKCKPNYQMTTESFIQKSHEIHGNKYDYSKVEYVRSSDKVCIICPKHGEFWQTPVSHLRGVACPNCRTSQLENEIEELLINNNIEFIRNRKYPWLQKDKDARSRLTLDFYLPQFNTAIECQGVQHFKRVPIFEGKGWGFEYIQNNDKIKKELCEKNGVKLLYYSNLGIEYPYEVFENKNELLKRIKGI